MAVEALDPETREQLAKGPAGPRFSCAVCDAFRSCDLSRDLPSDDPRWIVFNYHEVPKLRMQSANDQWYGPLAAEVYERCLAIYRAAGWSPEPKAVAA